MSILVFAAVVIILLALVIYGIKQAPIIEEPFKGILVFISIIVAVLAIASRL